ncbi:NAD(P)-binding protein [Mycena crocata]|nr:NAD(P)-binding protein [Mycena crocata]
MSPKKILVTGATGHQGRALIWALQESADAEHFHVLALTRTASSLAAQRLASEHLKFATILEGNLDAPEAVRKIFEDGRQDGPGIWGVFCVLAFPGLGANADVVERQGKNLADTALEYGVASFVFSSAERGGEYYDDQTELDTRAKVMIERHIKASGLPWTILRPGFFMENFNGFLGAITAGVLKNGLKPTTTNRLVAVDDIGQVAAARQNPAKYTSQILTVSGEVSTVSEQEEAYRRATGKKLPSIPWFLARALIALNAHTKALLEDLERKHDARQAGKCPEVEDQTATAMQAYPEMKTFEAWAGSQGEQSASQENWNQVSLFRLVTGRQ